MNSLMEWVDQTKKFSKALDYFALDFIDSVMKIRDYVDRRALIDNRKFFQTLCRRYHKPSPLSRLKRWKTRPRPVEIALSLLVRADISRIDELQKAVDIQWFEIIDFIYERPELVDPSILNDEYVRTQIDRVCSDQKKNNPFEDGMLNRLGRSWKDDGGRWRPERRKRF